MNNKKTRIVFLAIMFSVFTHAVLCVAQGELSSGVSPYNDALDTELKWLRAESYVITASRVMEEIDKSAASITVITSRQLRQMGARDITDAVTRFVPGVGQHPTIEGHRFITVRGDGTVAGTILYMINGHPVTNIYSGDTALAYDTLVIDNIKRVEFIRGPGSAIYGANAFLGVVNVITKEAEDIDGVELTARRGSWDSQQYNLLFGKAFSDLEAVINLNYFDKDGFRGLIEEDTQTLIDRLYPPFIPPASLAPGYTKGRSEKFDGALDLKYKGFRLEGKYIDRDFDTPVSLYAALVEKNVLEIEDYYLKLSYDASIGETLNLNSRVYWNINDLFLDAQSLPPGFVGLTPEGLPFMFESGLLHECEDKSERIGLEIELTYDAPGAHTIVAGATYEEQNVSTYVVGNYLPFAGNTLFTPLPSMQEWPDTHFTGYRERNFKALFLEDIWDLSEELRMTIGARYDHYYDFGGHLSPRIGLTWQFMTGYDLKLLYGHAFHAPTLFQMYSPDGGNPELDPETIDTYEVSLGAEMTTSLKGRATLFLNEKKNLIVNSASTAPWLTVNSGRSEIQGIEFEVKYDFGRGTYLAGNMTYIDMKTGLQEEYSSGKVMTNIRLSRHLNVYADLWFLYGLHKREPGDPMEDYKDHETANLTLIAKEFLKGLQGLELQASIYNMFDEDIGVPQGKDVPFDLPVPGRNYLFEMKFTF